MEKSMIKNNKQDNNFQEFFIAVKMKDKKDYIVYTSESFKLSEIDIINLIKICILEARSKIIGRKILAVYEDSTNDRKEVTIERLKKIGLEINNGKAETTTSKRPTIK
jgi:hypothetical protein